MGRLASTFVTDELNGESGTTQLFDKRLDVHHRQASPNIERVAFVAGKGSSFMGRAAQLGVDLFITGEAGYHGALEGAKNGMAVMELGHRESELFYLKTMTGWLEAARLKVKTLNVPLQRIDT